MSFFTAVEHIFGVAGGYRTPPQPSRLHSDWFRSRTNVPVSRLYLTPANRWNATAKLHITRFPRLSRACRWVQTATESGDRNPRGATEGPSFPDRDFRPVSPKSEALYEWRVARPEPKRAVRAAYLFKLIN